MNYIGIDIGSTATKVVVRGACSDRFVMPSGWNSKETSLAVRDRLMKAGIDVSKDTAVAATGYGRIAVDFSDYQITEITCHGRGGFEMAGEDCTIIDVGGQDTKIIQIENGQVSDFLMNDKCSAGTGKFLEIMANRMGITIDELFAFAGEGKPLAISSLCTVFAESEIVSYMGEGHSKENIAAGIVDSVAEKVSQLYGRRPANKRIYLTGGLSHCRQFADRIEERLNTEVRTLELGRYAGALGASMLAEEKSGK